MEQMNDLLSQALSFDPVLPWKGQTEAVERDEDGRIFLKIKAPWADRVLSLIHISRLCETLEASRGPARGE